MLIFQLASEQVINSFGTHYGWVTAAIAGAQAAYGIYQSMKAKKELARAQAQRPEYKTPEAALANQKLAANLAVTGIPDSQKKFAIENIDRAAQGAYDNIANRRGGLIGSTGVFQSKIDAYRNILSEDVAQRLRNQQMLMQQNANIASFQEKGQQVNQFQPYYDTINTNRALQAAGTQNIGGAIQSAGYAYDQTQQNKFNTDYLNFLKGNQQLGINQVNANKNLPEFISATSIPSQKFDYSSYTSPYGK